MERSHGSARVQRRVGEGNDRRRGSHERSDQSHLVFAFDEPAKQGHLVFQRSGLGEGSGARLPAEVAVTELAFGRK
jgi:hypothetical protein